MENNKLKVIQDYNKLNKDLQEQVKLVYPDGFSEYLVYFKNAKVQEVSALRFETDEKIYMLRMSVQMAFQIMEDDSDYDDEHNLKSSVKEIYEEKHADVEYLEENENYE
ncbi:MAG: hypothetical protein HQ522_05800 [Bacteroidetes bacterium]|nr:hypothetical protein [Bacteroidota bacterium]